MRMETNRKLLNKQQTKLRQVMTRFDQHDNAIRLFLSHHAMLHSAKMAQTETWSFEDDILNDMTEDKIRRIPRNCEHSVAWCIWHIARIEDVTMNMLVAGSPQVLDQKAWTERMNVSVHDTGNSMDDHSMAALSAEINVEELRAYRVAVGRRTQDIVQQLKPEELKQKVDPIRIQQVRDLGVVAEAAKSIVDYWSKRNIAGLLLMPATRHNIVHLNEALNLKQKHQ